MMEANAWTTNTELHSGALLYLIAGDGVYDFNGASANIQGGQNIFNSQFSGYLIG
jgi:hypothetical protein